MGIKDIHHRVRPHEVELVRRDYAASGGWETFLSYEDLQQDILIGLLRLRRCSDQTFRAELQGRCSIVRELHVYGSAVPMHDRDPGKFQHRVRGCRVFPRLYRPFTPSSRRAGLWHAAHGGRRENCAGRAPQRAHRSHFR